MLEGTWVERTIEHVPFPPSEIEDRPAAPIQNGAARHQAPPRQTALRQPVLDRPAAADEPIIHRVQRAPERPTQQQESVHLRRLRLQPRVQHQPRFQPRYHPVLVQPRIQPPNPYNQQRQ